MNKEICDKFIQFIKFGIVGLTNNVISYLVYITVLFLLKSLSFSKDYIVANVAGFFISVLWSFYWNNKYVFVKKSEEKRSVLKTLLKTYISYGFSGIILSNVLSYFWIEFLGISKLLSPLCNLIVTVPVNFALIKLWAFKNSSK